jgi:OmpA-OmpF porin, OOP family
MRPGAAVAFLVLLLAPLLLVPGLAAAQVANPSAAEILNALKPRHEAIGPSRGLRPAGEPTTTPAAARPAAGQPARMASTAAATADLPSIDLNVEFAFDSAVLTPAATKVLDALGTALVHPELAGQRFRIEGHTDTVGTRPYNQSLSERRANAVADYLAHQFKLPTAGLEPVGMGKDGLAVSTPDQTPEARNRRVHVVNLDG